MRPLRFRLAAILACLTLSGALSVQAGCAAAGAERATSARVELKQRALDFLKAGIRYSHNPAVRVEAVESLESCTGNDALPWVRAALLDENAGVRFAACVALGRRGDSLAESALRERARDEDGSVRVAALFALHCLGHTDRSGTMPVYLLEVEDPVVRRNAAFVLGLMGERGVIKILARAMKDADSGVRNYALEAMAMLGNAEARRELSFMTSAGVGAEEVFALQALAKTGDQAFLDTFRYKLATAPHVETRLAAAQGLGLLGSAEGLGPALVALKPTIRAAPADADDTPEARELRVRQLAIRALGAIGGPEALAALAQLMADSGDPRVQVCAAGAIVRIMETNEARALEATQPERRR